MTKEQELFLEIGEQLADSVQSQMFGKLCFKIKSKAFICFFQNEMVFKLKDEIHKEALNLDGSKLFDPSGKNRPMKEWVQVSYDYKDLWLKYAKEAIKYVSDSNK